MYEGCIFLPYCYLKRSTFTLCDGLSLDVVSADIFLFPVNMPYSNTTGVELVQSGMPFMCRSAGGPFQYKDAI